MQNQKGIFVVLYGTNRVGKTTQALKLLGRINGEKKWCAQYMKFPNYTLLPTGPRIDAYLRKENPEKLTTEQFAELCSQNRRDAEPRIKEILSNGNIVIAEDWTETGIVWAIATGVPENRARGMNKGFLAEDIAILIDGEPFAEGKEVGHTHEENSRLLLNVRNQYLHMAEEHEEWNLVTANQPVETVQRNIWNIVSTELKEIGFFD